MGREILAGSFDGTPAFPRSTREGGNINVARSNMTLQVRCVSDLLLAKWVIEEFEAVGDN